MHLGGARLDVQRLYHHRPDWISRAGRRTRLGWTRNGRIEPHRRADRAGYFVALLGNLGFRGEPGLDLRRNRLSLRPRGFRHHRAGALGRSHTEILIEQRAHPRIAAAGAGAAEDDGDDVAVIAPPGRYEI